MVGNHISPQAKPPPSVHSSSIAIEAENAKVTSEYEILSRLDSIVFQWIYCIISNDLLHTILKPNTTFSQVWQALETICQDNQSARVVYLDNKFVSTCLDHHPNISYDYQPMKMLEDQLAIVGNLMSIQKHVLQFD
uniref:Uncharacterized protein n=1 Tax=Lactuca sativa TaxID=4236 RepID=A0A9R1VRS0_LACSA|nr:hypothetical protein LSAT_V11C400223410 [Lactuca sativa]